MHIVTIKASRYPSRVYLKISNGLIIPLFIDDLVTLSLRSGLELDESKLTLIVEKSIRYLLRDYALRQIAISPKSERTMQGKLKQYFNRVLVKYNLPTHSLDPAKLTSDCVEKLKTDGLIKDNNYLEYFLKKHKNKSKRELSFLLQKEGISLNTNLITDDIGSEIEKIKKILIKKNVDQQKMSDFKNKNKIIAYLYRKGFSLPDIKTAIDELLYNR